MLGQQTWELAKERLAQRAQVSVPRMVRTPPPLSEREPKTAGQYITSGTARDSMHPEMQREYPVYAVLVPL